MKSTKTQKQLRVDDLIQFRLDGARFWHVRQYVTEKEKDLGSFWYRGENAEPYSDATLWRYIRWADEQIAEDTRSTRKKRIRVHVAKRQNVYTKAMAAGDLRTALAAADSEAKLLGLYPEKQLHVTGTPIGFNWDDLARQLGEAASDPCRVDLLQTEQKGSAENGDGPATYG